MVVYEDLVAGLVDGRHQSHPTGQAFVDLLVDSVSSELDHLWELLQREHVAKT